MPEETYTGDDSFDVPSDVNLLIVQLDGQDGEPSERNTEEDTRGIGGRVEGELDVSPGDTVYIRRVSGGSSGEATSDDYGGDGGDAIDLRLNGTDLSDRVAVAGGGGGGAGEIGGNDRTADGGDGGADTGGNGEDNSASESFWTDANGGDGGGQSGAGSGGSSGGDDGETDGEAGDGPEGGAGGDGGSNGGGGGAGYYGGGGGGGADASGAGGGGSNYTGGLATVITNAAGESEAGYGFSPEPPVATLIYVTAPTLDDATANSDNTVDLSWSDEGVSEYTVYRGDDSGSDKADYSEIATTSDTSYTDEPGDGQEVYYRVSAVDGDTESGLSNEESATTDLPAPTDLSVSNVGDDSADLSWTANHDNGETRVEVREDDEGDWETNTTVDYDTESATIDGLLNGQLYGVRVVADTGDAETEDE